MNLKPERISRPLVPERDVDSLVIDGVLLNPMRSKVKLGLRELRSIVTFDVLVRRVLT